MFRTNVDIGNRACQHCGVPRIDPVLGFTEVSQRAQEISFAYGTVKRAELRRNVWRFATRKAVLRPVDTNTLMLAPAMWSSVTTYFRGSIVTDENGFIWISKIPNNLGNTPENSYTWEPYFGPLTVSLYDSTVSYLAGEVVYTAAGNGTCNVYLSLISGNALDPSLPNQWSVATTYFQNQVVEVFPPWASGTTYGAGQAVTYTDGNIYASLVGGNVGNIPPNTLGTDWALAPVITIASQQVPITGNAITPPQSSPVVEWSQPNTYSIGNFVMFNGTEYVSLTNNNAGNFPNAVGSTSWTAVTGGSLYMSLIDLNIGNNPSNAPALWSNATTYAVNNLVGGSDGVIYKSLANGNTGNDPTTDGGVHWQNTGVLNQWTTVFTQGGGNQQWLQIGGAAFPSGVGLATLDIVYPLGSGPASQSTTRNVFRLPAGYIRVAPQDPAAGAMSDFGAPTNLPATDWVYEGNYIVSAESGVIILRFVADVADVTQFDDMFCEAFAARIADAVCETLTQSTAKLAQIERTFKKWEADAITVNGIEEGPQEAELDDFIACRY